MATRIKDDFDLGRTLAWLLFGTLASGVAFVILFALSPEPRIQAEVPAKPGNFALQEVADGTPPWREEDKAPEPIKLTADLR